MKIYKSNCKMPTVSVISLVYNHEEYLETAIQSIISQKTEFEYEIIFHDDASTDSSLAILLEYQKRYPNIITVITEEKNIYFDTDVSIIRDIILPHAKGKYIAFCEGDDFWCSENKLQKQVTFLENNDSYSGCIHPVQVVDNEGNRSEKIIFDTNKEYDILQLNSTLDFSQTTSYMCRNPMNVKFDNNLMSEAIYGWDKNFAIYMVKSGKVRVLSQVMSCYRHVTTKGTSSEARENLSNLTKDKVKAEWDLYNQLRAYKMLDDKPYFYSDHYCNNVTIYSLRKLFKYPSKNNIKLFIWGIKKSPYPIWVILKFLVLRLHNKFNRSLKSGR